MAAATTLLKVMDDPTTPASTRVRAAESVLTHAARSIELEDLQARVDDLERAAMETDRDQNSKTTARPPEEGHFSIRTPNSNLSSGLDSWQRNESTAEGATDNTDEGRPVGRKAHSHWRDGAAAATKSFNNSQHFLSGWFRLFSSAIVVEYLLEPQPDHHLPVTRRAGIRAQGVDKAEPAG